MITSEMVKKEIRTINPEITDKLLDLLYEYIKLKEYEHTKEKHATGCYIVTEFDEDNPAIKSAREAIEYIKRHS